jgi:hypothetical protein
MFLLLKLKLSIPLPKPLDSPTFASQIEQTEYNRMT